VRIDIDSTPMKCRVSTNGHNPVDIQPTTLAGALEIPVTETQYNGHRITATFENGDAYESQQSVGLSVDDAHSTVYNPGDEGLYRLGRTDGTDLQCWFE
jgi:hypothetical protein